MKNITYLLLLVASLGGCTSLNGLVAGHYETDPHSGEPVYQDYLADNYGSSARGIAYGMAKEMELTFLNNDYAVINQNSTLDVEYIPTGDGAEVSLTWTSTKALFPPGEYNIASERTRQYNQREAASFVDLASKGIAKLIDNLKAAGMEQNYSISATYEGLADGIPIRGPLYYQGEFGQVQMPYEATHYNGSPHQFYIQQGQQIRNNAELAALRAYGLRSFLHGRLQYLGYSPIIMDNYEVKTTHKRGAAFRSAKISILVREQ